MSSTKSRICSYCKICFVSTDDSACCSKKCAEASRVKNGGEASKKFEKGQKVRCIDATGLVMLEKGRTYTIHSFSGLDQDKLDLAEFSWQTNFEPHRFEEVESDTAPLCANSNCPNYDETAEKLLQWCSSTCKPYLEGSGTPDSMSMHFKVSGEQTSPSYDTKVVLNIPATATFCSNPLCKYSHPDITTTNRCEACLAGQAQNAQFAGQFNFGPGKVGVDLASGKDFSAFTCHKGGAQRSTDADEHRFDLVPQRMLERVARVMKKGADKYGAYNWQKGFSWSSIFNHLLRHCYLYLVGDTTEDHLAHMVCNLGFLIEYETSHPELNDIPSRGISPDASRETTVPEQPTTPPPGTSDETELRRSLDLLCDLAYYDTTQPN